VPKPVGKLQHKSREQLSLQSLARSHTEMALRTICDIAQNGKSEAARVAAAAIILDRAWGRVPVAHADTDGDKRIVVEVIYGNRADGEMKTIEHHSNGDDSGK
jgi:hypothetical protein